MAIVNIMTTAKRKELSESEQITIALIDAFKAYGIFGRPEGENKEVEIRCDANKAFI